MITMMYSHIQVSANFGSLSMATLIMIYSHIQVGPNCGIAEHGYFHRDVLSHLGGC